MKKIVMSKDDVAKEHKRLIPLLMSGSEKMRAKEARNQQREMKRYGINVSLHGKAH